MYDEAHLELPSTTHFRYPGSAAKMAAFRTAFPDAKELGLPLVRSQGSLGEVSGLPAGRMLCCHARQIGCIVLEVAHPQRNERNMSEPCCPGIILNSLYPYLTL